jgi:Uma2 family endonuclease
VTYKQHPCLVIEVLSESTEAFDRGNKFADYRQLISLQEYVLVSTKQHSIDCFYRQDSGLWTLQPYNSQSSTIQLQSVNFSIDLATIYEDVEFGS